LAYSWNVLKFESEESDLIEYTRRKQFITKYLEDKNDYIKYFYANERTIKMFVSFLILLFMVLIFVLKVVLNLKKKFFFLDWYCCPRCGCCCAVSYLCKLFYLKS
jgi:hypothetical protein